MATNTLTPRGAFAMGLLVIACGVVPILGGLGALPGARGAIPPWVPIFVGGVFVIGGVSIIVSYGIAGGVDADGQPKPGTPYSIQVLQYLLNLAIIGALAAVAGWVAFGPGERSFSIGAGSGAVAVGGAGNSLAGRIAFGVFTVLAAAMFVYSAISGAHRLSNIARQLPDRSMRHPK
jgi:hypothetical protein